MSRKRRATETTRRMERDVSGARDRRGTADETASIPRAALSLWLILAGLVLARAVLAFPHSMGAWGLNLLRFVPPIPGWSPWILSALALIPAVARRLEPWARRLFEWRARASWTAYAPWALAAAAMAWFFPDRLHFAGDFMLRETSIASPQSIFKILYPQGLPLDAILHDSMVRVLAPAFGNDPHQVGRALGALEAGMLGALAGHFARVLDLPGSAAFAASSLVLWGGCFSLFCGYNKAFAEMILVTAAVGVFGIEAIRRGSGLVWLGVAVAIGLVLHRMSIALVPAWLVAWILWFRWRGKPADEVSLGAPGDGRRLSILIAAAIPIVTLAVMAPRLARVVTGFDPGNFLSADVAREGGVFAAAFSGTRPADLLDIMIVLSPLAPVIALVFMIGGARVGSESQTGSSDGTLGEGILLVALAAPLVAFAPFYHPPQGLFRDWDAFAATGMALSLAAAWVVGETLRSSERYSWLALAVALGAFTPTAHWLMHHSDADHGIEQVEAFVKEPPVRTDLERGTAWDFLGMRQLELGRNDASADAFSRAAEITPSPKILRGWAASETARGDRERARGIYRRLLARSPDDGQAWTEYMMLSVQVRDADEAERAAKEVLRLRPGEPHAQSVLESVERARVR